MLVASGWSDYWCVFSFFLILFRAFQVVGVFYPFGMFYFYNGIVLNNIAIEEENKQIENVVYLQLIL